MKVLNKEIPIFGGRLRVIICDNIEEIEERYNLGDTSDCDAISFKTKDKNGCNRIYCMAFNKEYFVEHIIAHESLHIANFILRDIHHISTYENDEVQAYLLTWIVKETVKFTKK